MPPRTVCRRPSLAWTMHAKAERVILRVVHEQGRRTPFTVLVRGGHYKAVAPVSLKAQLTV